MKLTGLWGRAQTLAKKAAVSTPFKNNNALIHLPSLALPLP